MSFEIRQLVNESAYNAMQLEKSTDEYTTFCLSDKTEGIDNRLGYI